jgi:hypothetical protein
MAKESYVVGNSTKKLCVFIRGAFSVNHPREKSNAMLRDSYRADPRRKLLEK